MAVNLDTESRGDMDEVVEMREVIVRTGNDRCRHDIQQPLCGSGG